MPDGRSTRDSDRFEDCREVLDTCSLPGVDNASLLDYIDLLEDEGYNDQVNLEPDWRNYNVVFEIGLRAGYACGLQDGGSDE